jgi:hypothetical protein
MGRRRGPPRLPWGPVAVMVAAFVVVVVLLAVPNPSNSAPLPLNTNAVVVPTPTFHGPETADSPGALADATPFTPRIYITPQIAVGVAPTDDARSVRLVARSGSKVVELRRIIATANPQFAGFVISGSTLAWAESSTNGGGGTSTAIWKTNWHTLTRPVLVTTDTQDATFAGSQYDMVVHDDRIYWTATLDGGTQVRSVGLDGYDTQWQDLNGDFGLSAWPWLVSPGGRGKAVTLYNLSTGGQVTVRPGRTQTASCTPTWCRLDTAAATGLARIDIRRTDGTGSAQAAGPEATPAIPDAVLLDRYLPLITDQESGTGLSLYDVTTGQTSLIALNIDNVRAYGGVLWWSTTDVTGLTWHALDLHSLP